MSYETEFNPLLILLDEFENTGDDFNPLLILLEEAENTRRFCFAREFREEWGEMCDELRRSVGEIFQGVLQGKKHKTSERLVEISKDEPSVTLVPQSKPLVIQDKTVFQCETVIASQSESASPVCVTLLSGDTQTGMNGMLGIPESVPDQLPFAYCPTIGRLMPGDSNSLIPNSPTSDIVDEERDRPFLVLDDGLTRRSDLEASLDIQSINC